MDNTKFSDKKQLEKYSSAFTLSDMEIFIFPELFFPLVLANIMSPIIWEWKNDPWFRNISKKNINYKVNRIKQFIIDHYVFNLDLETWGLTTKQKELDRFSDFVDISMLEQSNALFGYEGDKYYFDIDIRKHFGLDKYNSDVIPYWKTETVEAMTGFSHKPEYTTGAGECVSLSALYAAALFIVGEIPLEDIYLFATPLHSQNFIAVNDGIVTNNRRIVTKNMWYNGTLLTQKARRALENERVTIVSHITGHIHTLYHDASISPEAYIHFSDKLKKFLQASFNSLVLSNFLRANMKFRALFQFIQIRNGKKHYIRLEKIYRYEHSSKHSFSGNSRIALLKEIDGDEFDLCPIKDRISINDFEHFLHNNQKFGYEELKEKIKTEFGGNTDLNDFFTELDSFIRLEPRLPSACKNYKEHSPLKFPENTTREEIMNIIASTAQKDEMANLALYTYRDMEHINWLPFIKACIERNPVSIEANKNSSVEQVYKRLKKMKSISLYEGKRLSMPDEVWNFGTGDGLEKAIALVNFIISKHKDASIHISSKGPQVNVAFNNSEFIFDTNKDLQKTIQIHHGEIDTGHS